MSGIISPATPNIAATIAAIQAKIAGSDLLAAAAMCDKVLASTADDPELLRIAAQCAFTLWDFNVAGNRFTKLLSLLPDDLYALQKLGEVQEALGRPEGMRSYATKILTLEPGNIPAQHMLGRYFASNSQWQEAIDCLSVGEMHRNAASTAALVRAHLGRNQRHSAVQVLLKIDAPFPNQHGALDSALADLAAELAFACASDGDVDTVKQLTYVLVHLGAHEQAEALFQFADEAGVADLSHELAYARFLKNSQRDDEAIARLQSISMRPEHTSQDLQQIAWELAYCGAIEESVRLLLQFMSDDEDSAGLLSALASHLRARQGDDAGLALFACALAKCSDSAHLANAYEAYAIGGLSHAELISRLNHIHEALHAFALGELFLKRQRWPFAAQAFGRTLILDAGHPTAKALQDFSLCMEHLDRALEAKSAWRLGEAMNLATKALNLLSQPNAQVLHCRGELYYELGDFEGAVRDHCAAVSIAPSEKGEKLLREAQQRLSYPVSDNTALENTAQDAIPAHRSVAELADAVAHGRARIEEIPLVSHPQADDFIDGLSCMQQSSLHIAWLLTQSHHTPEATAALIAWLDEPRTSGSLKLLLTENHTYRLVVVPAAEPAPNENWMILCDMAYRLKASDFQQAALAALELGVAATPALKSGMREGCPYTTFPPWAVWKKSVAEISPDAIAPQLHGKFRIPTDARIATAGSCFAQNISRYLPKWGYAVLSTEQGPAHLTEADRKRRGYGVFSARFGNIYTPLQLLQLIDRAYGHFHPIDDHWIDADGIKDPFRPHLDPSFKSVAALRADRHKHFAAVRRMFETLDVLVFTLGLTETWMSRADGAVFPTCPGCGGGSFDPAKHQFVNFRVSDVVEHMNRFLARLAQVNPSARVILTVSPVPLVATMEERHVLASTVCSKSILRAAADELTRQHPHVDYFAAYEIITSTFQSHLYYAGDRRNVTERGVDHVMKVFSSTYLNEAIEASVESHQHTADSSRSPARDTESYPAVYCEEEQAYTDDLTDLDIVTRTGIEFYVGDEVHLCCAPAEHENAAYHEYIRVQFDKRTVIYKDRRAWFERLLIELSTHPLVLCLGSSQTMHVVNWPYPLHQELRASETYNPIVLNAGMGGTTSLEMLCTFQALCRLLDASNAPRPRMALSMLGSTDILYRAFKFHHHVLGGDPLPMTLRESAFLRQNNAKALIIEAGELVASETSLTPPGEDSPFPLIQLPERWTTNIIERACKSLLALDAGIKGAGVPSSMILQPISTRAVVSDYVPLARERYAKLVDSPGLNFQTWRAKNNVLSHAGEYRDESATRVCPDKPHEPALDLDELYGRLQAFWHSGLNSPFSDSLDLMHLRILGESSPDKRPLFTKDALHYDPEGSRLIAKYVAAHVNGRL